MPENDADPALPLEVHRRAGRPMRRPHRLSPGPSCPWRPALLAGALAAAPAAALDVSEQLQLNGVLAGAYQCQQISGDAAAPDACRGGGALQPELVYQPTSADQVYVRLGLGAGNGLNTVSPFELAPWAADLEDDVKDINGSGRSYLLEAWYGHTFVLPGDGSLQVIGGIIDPSAYFNENAYANDEFTQFSNQAFVNARNLFMPAYDWGGVLAWSAGDWSFSGAAMAVAENDQGRAYTWYGAELGYHPSTRLGAGNYRVMYGGTSRDFAHRAGDGTEPLEGLILSFDQALGEVVGIFLRAAWELTEAAGTYQSGYEGGLDLRGAAWGREADNIGIGYGHAHGGDSDVFQSDVVECYYRYAITEQLALTADVQWMKDSYRGADDIEGWIVGVRAVAEF